MIERVISGGQTGADQAGWRAARAAGIATGGWMPKGFLTEDGPRPEFAELYGAKEHTSLQYPPRTKANAAEADYTLWFGESGTPGYRCTLEAVAKYGKKYRDGKSSFSNCFWGHDRSRYKPVLVARFLERDCVRVLNVAGNRESSSPGIGVWVEEYLAEVFRLLTIPANQETIR